MRPALAPLYPIIDVAFGRAERPFAVAEALLGVGVPWIQLRVKSTPGRDHLTIARRLVERAAAHGTRVVVNDRLDVALASGAAGVHLGQTDLPLHAALPIAHSRGLIVGISTHSVDQARAAQAGGADYIGFGPMYATPTKPDALAPRPKGDLAAARAAVALPIVAIGGITPRTAPRVLAAGADAVAMIGALAQAPDPAELARRVLALSSDALH